MAQSQVPDIPYELLLKAAQSPGAGDAIQSGIAGFKQGADLASTLQQRKLERQKLMQDLEKEKQAALMQVKQQKAAAQIPTLAAPITPESTAATIGGKQIPLSAITPTAPTPEGSFAPDMTAKPVAETIETERKPALTSAIATAYPKEYSESILKQNETKSLMDKLKLEQAMAPASTEQQAQYKQQTGRDLPAGTTFAQADKILGTAIRGSLANSRQQLVELGRDRLGVTKIKTVDDVFKQADPKRASPTSAVGREYQRLTSAQRMVAVAGTRAGQLTPQQVTTVASEVANLALAGGQSQRIASELIEKYIPETLGMTIAQKTQYLTAHPQDAKVQAVINPLIQEGLRIAVLSEQNIRNTQKDLLSEASAISDLSPQQYRRASERLGINPDTLEVSGSIIPQFNPSEWYDKVKTLPEGTAVPDLLKQGEQSSGIPQVGQTFNGGKVISVKRID